MTKTQIHTLKRGLSILNKFKPVIMRLFKRKCTINYFRIFQ